MKKNQGQGRFVANRQGFGFIVTDDERADLFVSADETGGALHNDIVRFLIVRDGTPRRNPEAVIQGIARRGTNQFTGSIQGSKRQLHLVPDHPLFPLSMRLAGPKKELHQGLKVLCRLRDATFPHLPAAEVVRILGDDTDALLDADTVIAEFGLPGEYPAAALVEAERIIKKAKAAVSSSEANKSGKRSPSEREAPENPPPTSTYHRRDFRSELVVTIDPHDARDFDDAVSLIRETNGDWHLRVHIADVASGIAPGSELDREARTRGNSTYLPGRMIPMLPESLCNGLMSLSPGDDKNVLTVSMKIDPDGRVKAYRLDEGLILSRYRLNYEQVQRILTGEETAEPDLMKLLTDMNNLAQALRKRRFSRGGVSLDLPEVDLKLDDSGLPVYLGRKFSDQSHQLIEEFMILANRITCRAADTANQPFMHRRHDSPDLLKLDSFRRDVVILDPTVTSRDLHDIASIRRWLSKLEPSPRTWRINSLFLQTMQRALYESSAYGHFGLGLRWYGHFTSPIRRYADLFNHRVIKWMIHNPQQSFPESLRLEADEIAQQCSGNEQRSELAERAMIRLKLLRWAEKQLGKSYLGAVVSVRKSGYFVELDRYPLTGYVPRDDLFGQVPYINDKTRLGGALGDLQVGNAVIVQITRVDFRNRQIIYTIRAAGKRALQTDPDHFDPLIDPTETGRKVSAKSKQKRKIKRKPRLSRNRSKRRR